MKVVRLIVLLLVVIGAINWGLWGAFQYDVIQDLFGSDVSLWAKSAYILVGLSGIYAISFFFSEGICACGCKKHKKK